MRSLPPTSIQALAPRALHAAAQSAAVQHVPLTEANHCEQGHAARLEQEAA